MTTRLRLLRSLHQRMMADLVRAHPYARERVGWVVGRTATGPADNTLVVAYDYLDVPDDEYIDDPRVGARFNRNVIRRAMQHCVDTGDSVFCVHFHDHSGRPVFSRTDHRGLWPLVPPLRTLAPQAAHGLLLLSLDEAVAIAWPPPSKEPMACSVRVVGRPMGLF